MCQKARWKEHKELCQRQQHARANATSEAVKRVSDLQAWTRRNLTFVNIAGYAALLQHKDYLEHHLLDTHLLSVKLTPSSTPGEFDVDSADILPFEALKFVYHVTGQADGDAEYAIMMESMERGIANAAKISGKIAGTMFVVIWCERVMDTHPLAVSQDIVDELKQVAQPSDWLTTLKTSVVTSRDRVYKTEGGQFTVRHPSSLRR